MSLIPTPTGTTRVAGLLGHPARYSLSPALHNAAYQAMGLDAVYVVFPTPPQRVAEAVLAIRALDLLGVSVTMPHKEAVISSLDSLTPQAQVLQAVNTILHDDGKLIGHNTDGEGFVASLRRDLHFEPAGATCVVIGAGGAARSIIAALAEAGAASVTVVNRTAARAAEAAALAGPAGRVGIVDDVADADLVVNATSVGMQVGETPVPSILFSGNQVVVDTIYHPAETRFLQEAKERGAHTANGLGMLLHQAVAQIELWTGRTPPIDVMRASIEGR